VPLYLIAVESDLTRPFSDIAVVSFNGSYYNQLTTYGYNADPVFSPDGQFIAYRSVPASITTLPDPGSLLYSGQYNIWVITWDGAQAWKLTDSEMLRSIPSWSPDSRRVAFSEGEAGALVEVEVATQTRRELLTGGGRDPRYRPDGNGIGYITAEGGLNWLDGVGSARVLVDAATLPPLTTVHDFDWLPDGQALVYSLADESERIEGTTVGIQYSVWLLKLAESAPIKLADDVHDVQVSPDGQTIAARRGSGFGDACLVDLQTVFLFLALDRNSASVISIDDFAGLPAVSPDGVFYPTSKVVWVSAHQAVGQFSLTCTADPTALGAYAIDVSARQIAHIIPSQIVIKQPQVP
jgi:dipeptidyl aminopeptidase/acylaminoacyl peptidase